MHDLNATLELDTHNNLHYCKAVNHSHMQRAANLLFSGIEGEHLPFCERTSSIRHIFQDDTKSEPNLQKAVEHMLMYHFTEQ